MNDKIRFNFPEVQLYLAFIFVLSIVISYFDRQIGLFVFLIFVYLVYYNARAIKYKNNDLLVDFKNLSIDMDEISKQTMLDFPVPFCVINEYGNIKWNNEKMTDMLSNDELIEKNLGSLLNNLDIDKLIPKANEEIMSMDDYVVGDKHYKIQTVDIAKNNQKAKKYAVYFFDISSELLLIDKYNEIKPVILSVQVDNFNDVVESAADDFRPLLEADIERHIRFWVEKKDGILTKLSKDKFFCVFNEPMLKQAEEEKFSILDDLREIELSNTIPVTLSIGASTYEQNLAYTNKNAMSALDMALGRGGDQAVCKIYDKTVFYGGKSKAVEKKTRVRARIVGHAMRDLIKKSSNVLVMGHSYPDLDAIGACMGIVAICNMLESPVKIVLSSSNKSIDDLYYKIKNTEGYKDIFITHDETSKYINEQTLLIVVDTNKASLTEMPQLTEIVDKIVLIDHHRRGIEFLDKAVLTFHETYASSASEMITELVQYVKDGAKLDVLTAEALLSGITLDTKNFAFNTGVRTFEAAAFLRKNGADPLEIKKFFKGDFENFIVKADCIKNARIIEDIIAISSYDKKIKGPSLIAAQIADELLGIKGIQASFVVIEGINGSVQVSARSIENINVQVIMEKLGGGGHIDTAATQIRDKSVDEVIALVEETVKIYLKEEYNK